MGLVIIPTRSADPVQVRTILERAGIDVDVAAVGTAGNLYRIGCRLGDESCVINLHGDASAFQISDKPGSWRWTGYPEMPLGHIFTGIAFDKHPFEVDVLNLLFENGLLMMKGPLPVPARIQSRCPKCGKLLRSDLAKQCFSCGADWH
jgi:hypothetical protein